MLLYFNDVEFIECYGKTRARTIIYYRNEVYEGIKVPRMNFLNSPQYAVTIVSKQFHR